MNIPSLDTKPAFINRTGLAGGCAGEFTIKGLKKKIASASAIGAGR